MATFPSLDEVLGVLSTIIGGQPVDPDAALADLVVDSLDLLEWSFTLEERYHLRIGDELLTAIDYGKPLRELYLDLRAEIEARV